MYMKAPSQLPPSTPPVLAMRVVAEVFAASWLDRQDYGFETAWFGWSGGSQVQPWAGHFGIDVSGLQSGLDTGRLNWESVYLQLSGLFRVGVMVNGDLGPRAWAFDMGAAVAYRLEGKQLRETLDIQQSYLDSGRRLEPLAARLLAAMRR